MLMKARIPNQATVCDGVLRHCVLHGSHDIPKNATRLLIVLVLTSLGNLGGDIMKHLKFLIAAALLVACSTTAYAHSGGTDENGCHNNRKSGDHHCH